MNFYSPDNSVNLIINFNFSKNCRRFWSFKSDFRLFDKGSEGLKEKLDFYDSESINNNNTITNDK